MNRKRRGGGRREENWIKKDGNEKKKSIYIYTYKMSKYKGQKYLKELIPF
jgi:hypothetical protein